MLKEQMHFWEKFQLNSGPRDAQGYFPSAGLEGDTYFNKLLLHNYSLTGNCIDQMSVHSGIFLQIWDGTGPTSL
jgi:hypothetical protein